MRLGTVRPGVYSNHRSTGEFLHPTAVNSIELVSWLAAHERSDYRKLSRVEHGAPRRQYIRSQNSRSPVTHWVKAGVCLRSVYV